MKTCALLLFLAACGPDLAVPAPDPTVDAGDRFGGPHFGPLCSCGTDEGATWDIYTCTYVPDGFPIKRCFWLSADGGTPPQ